MSGFSPPELEGPLGPHDPFERPQIGARAGGESTRLFVGVLLGGLLVAMIVAGFLLSGRPPRTGITALPPAATPPSAPPPPPHETAAAPQQPTRITSGASRTEAPEESPAKPPDIEAIRASLNAAAQALAGMPEDARQPFEIAANLLAAQWPEMGRADFESLVGSLVSYVHAEANASGATAPPSIESIGAASRRLSPTSGQRLTATDLAQTVFACGMLARLAVESDLPLPARARVDSMLADANLARPLSAADAFWSAAATALRRAPAYIVARPATGAKGPSDTGPESVWRRWLAAVRAVSVVLPERRDDLLLAATRELMLTASAGPPDAASRSLMQSILADASWGPSPTPGGDATPARQGVLDLLDDARISSRELAGLTQWLVGSVPAAGLGVDCILRTDAGPADRAKARDRISSAWNIRPPGEADALRGRWIAEAKRDLAASPATPSPIDRLSRVATLARLCEAAACLRRGDAATAKSILDNPAGPVEAAKQSPAHSTPATLVSDPLRDGKWALRFLSARRSAAERRRAVAELGGSTAQLGPVDAETLLDAAVFGSPGDVRVAALRIAERHATEPAMVNALLEQLPRAPRNDAVAGLIARASLTALPPARDRSWPVAARRALVSRLLGQLSGASELAAVDRLAEVVGDAYAGWAGPMFAGPKSATAPADASADEKSAARAAAVDPGVAADRVRASLRAEIASFAASNPGQRDALLPALAAADRRHAARRSLAEGPVQEFEAGIVAVTDLLGLLAQAERPASAETVAKALGELWVARRGSDDVYEHLNACQETATRLWLLRLSPEDAASPPPAAKTKPPESLRKDVR